VVCSAEDGEENHVDKSYKTIKELVLSFIRSHRGDVDYDELEREVLRHFPSSAFNRKHWAWYRYQCTKGRFAQELDDAQRAELKTHRTLRRPSALKGEEEDGDALETLRVGPDMLDAVRAVIESSRAYEEAVGGSRKMGITGEVGEILACHHLGLSLCMDPRSEGYDAVDREGRHVQIKTRRSESGGLPRDVGRIGTFSDHPFDYALLVVLNEDYSLAEGWRA